MFTIAQYCHHDGEPIFVFFPLAPSTFLNCCLFNGKNKTPASDKWQRWFWFWGRWVCMTCHVLNFALKRANELCFQPCYFPMMNKRGLTLNCGIFQWERCALLLHTDFYHSNMKSTYSHRCRRIWNPWVKNLKHDQNCSKTYSCGFCVGKVCGGNKASFLSLIHPPLQLFVVLWWCVSCVPPCCSHHHHHVIRHGDILLYQKRN